jgi:hypothetical protein
MNDGTNGWRYVCDDEFDYDNNGAAVACRELGFTGGTHSDASSPADLFYDSVICTGAEAALSDCSFSTTEDCGTSEAVALTCDAAPTSECENDMHSKIMDAVVHHIPEHLQYLHEDVRDTRRGVEEMQESINRLKEAIASLKEKDTSCKR